MDEQIADPMDTPGMREVQRLARQARQALGIPEPPPPPPRRPRTPEEQERGRQWRAEYEARMDGGFDYELAIYDRTDEKVLALRRVKGRTPVVVFDAAYSGSWIFDPAVRGEIVHQSLMENHYEVVQVSRERAEEAARARGLTLPGEEELARICDGQIGRMFGMSATRDDPAL